VDRKKKGKENLRWKSSRRHQSDSPAISIRLEQKQRLEIQG